MCGIHGVVALKRPQQFPSQWLDLMGDITAHRGPDDSGKYLAENVALGMRRLSVIDLTGGQQPISNEDGSLVLVCNGEIYNYRELRAQLADSYHFKTQSDVEVILALYQQYGVECLQHLNGMFAFALWDNNRQQLLLARDRLGIKPLYLCQHNGYLAFSTESKAILALPGIEAEVCPQALEQYLQLGYVPAPYSMFKGIQKLEVASYLLITDKGMQKQQYWQPDFDQSEQLSEQSWTRKIRSQLESSVAMQMVSDVPIGAFLSGGVDSSAIVALMSKHSKEHSKGPVQTYAIGFDTGDAGNFYNELPYARAVAEQFGTKHREILVKPDVVSLLPKLLWHMDEPIADSAFITTYLVSEFAHKDVTVILSGVGGDELFGGYRRYLGEHYLQKYRRLPAWLRQKLLVPLAGKLPSDRHSKLLNTLRLTKAFIQSAELDDAERYQRYMQVFSQQQTEQLLNTSAPANAIKQHYQLSKASQGLWRMFDTDRQSQLPDDLLLLTDKMTMATSLECRVPFLDHQMVELAVKIPQSLTMKNGRLKHLLKESLNDILPASILDRPKRGFGAPLGAWLKQELAGMLRLFVNRETIEKRGLLNWSIIEQTLSQHFSQQEDHTDHLLALMNLEIWCRLYLDKQSAEHISETIRTSL
ncbi:asparagine synthase (glutamine-hydrolyzing) [Arsukibacterium sp. UBA3155]|uniref:asparagine synthase (glutamine-hydrolyzing) n=1 Tax=Arsukibacterium sp. UBA3155 TaxID=1946058 RepID=UPI0025C37238|nr:asparagine synthase (glutamine-hydrolyzing) [Arsukibacterium sp. UBA3155]|tara:strand:+ start:14332 stop:16263 length:1932 start_codon:yes stop_codon:yes gene_type:complete